jgi:hypothetical protein
MSAADAGAAEPRLAPPDRLWAWWAACAVAYHGLGDETMMDVDDAGTTLDWDDGGGNYAVFWRSPDGAAAAVWGNDHEYTRTGEWGIDVREGAPSWLPAEVADRAAEGRLGFCFWWDATAGAWAHAPYPDGADPVQDGLTTVGIPRTRAIALADHAGIVEAWGDPAPGADLPGHAAAVLDAAERATLTPDLLAALLTGDDADLSAALDVAHDARIAPPA